MTQIKIGFSFAWRSLRASYLSIVALWVGWWCTVLYFHFEWGLLTKIAYIFLILVSLLLAKVAEEAATETLGIYEMRYNGFPVGVVPVFLFWCGVLSDWLFNHQMKAFWTAHFLIKPLASAIESIAQLYLAGWYLSTFCGDIIPRGSLHPSPND